MAEIIPIAVTGNAGMNTPALAGGMSNQTVKSLALSIVNRQKLKVSQVPTIPAAVVI